MKLKMMLLAATLMAGFIGTAVAEDDPLSMSPAAVLQMARNSCMTDVLGGPVHNDSGALLPPVSSDTKRAAWCASKAFGYILPGEEEKDAEKIASKRLEEKLAEMKSCGIEVTGSEVAHWEYGGFYYRINYLEKIRVHWIEQTLTYIPPSSDWTDERPAFTHDDAINSISFQPGCVLVRDEYHDDVNWKITIRCPDYEHIGPYVRSKVEAVDLGDCGVLGLCGGK